VSTATRAANRPPPVSSSSPPRQLDLPIRRAPRSTRLDAQPPRLPTPNTGIDPDETQDEDEILDPSGNPVPERARMPEIMRQQRQATTNDPAHYANHPTSDRCQRCQDLNKSCCDLSVTGFPCRWCVHDNQICRDGSGRAVNRQSIHLRPEPVLPPVPQGASRHSAQARRAAYPASRRNNYPATRRQASNVKSKNNNNDNNGNKAKAKTTSSSPSSAAPVQRRGRRNTSTRNTNRNRSESPERDLIPCGNCKAAGEQCDFATPCRPCRLVKKEFTCSKDISYGEGAPQRNYYNGGDDNENDDADDDGNDDDDDLYNDDSTPADRKVAAIAAAIRNSRQTYNQEHAARFQKYVSVYPPLQSFVNRWVVTCPYTHILIVHVVPSARHQAWQEHRIKEPQRWEIQCGTPKHTLPTHGYLQCQDPEIHTSSISGCIHPTLEVKHWCKRVRTVALVALLNR